MVDESVLRTITSSTNGLYIPATDTRMLRSVYKTLSDTFDKSYLISYSLSTKPGDEVEVHIKAEFERDGEDYIGEAVCSTDWIR